MYIGQTLGVDSVQIAEVIIRIYFAEQARRPDCVVVVSTSII